MSFPLKQEDSYGKEFFEVDAGGGRISILRLVWRVCPYWSKCFLLKVFNKVKNNTKIIHLQKNVSMRYVTKK